MSFIRAKEIPPAQVAGLEYDWHNWADVVEYKKEPLKRVTVESA